MPVLELIVVCTVDGETIGLVKLESSDDSL